MSDFDPYYKWLAIPPHEQPPDHYRLLGVPLFTDDADVIENAADQRMSHLRSYQAGKHSAESQRLLNEVAVARACLLVPERRQDYDAALKKKLQPPAQQTAPQPLHSLPQPVVRPVAPPFVAPLQPQFVATRPQFAPPTQLPLPARTPIPIQQPASAPPIVPAPPTIALSAPRKRKPAAGRDATKHIAASLVGSLFGYFIVCLILPRYDVLGLFHSRPVDPPAVTQTPPQPMPDQSNPISPPKPKAVEPVSVSPKPITQPTVEQPAETKKFETKPAETKINATKKTETKNPDPLPPAGSESNQQQARIAKLKADRTMAAEKNEISAVLLITDELAKLEAMDPLVERARMIDEMRKAERSTAEFILLAAHLIDVATAASKAERHDFATEQATAALLLARKSGDQELVRKATKLVLEVQEKK